MVIFDIIQPHINYKKYLYIFILLDFHYIFIYIMKNIQPKIEFLKFSSDHFSLKTCLYTSC